MPENWLGLDIGGANIKYADLRNCVGNVEFAMWKHPELLSRVLQTAIPDWHRHDRLAVTMTGELADCFETRQQGVAHICDEVVNASSASQLLFYQTSGDFVVATSAKDNWLLTAASNWHAVARFAGRAYPDCVVIDIGSTTTDVIPVLEGNPAAIGQTDFGRLKNGELVYTGISRSPVCAVLPNANIDGIAIPLAQEMFATMLDAYIVLEKIPESHSCRHTADGRPANRDFALSRLARMFCSDRDELKTETLVSLAEQAARHQAAMIQAAILAAGKRLSDATHYVVCGEGAWLAEQLLSRLQVDRQYIHSFAVAAGLPQDDAAVAAAGTAFATAQLARSFNGCQR